MKLKEFYLRGSFCGLALYVLVLFSGFVAAASSPAPNLVADGDFDRPDLRLTRSMEPGQWIVHGLGAKDIQVKITDGAGRNGTRGLRYHRTEKSKANVHADQTVPVKKNTIYEVSAFVRWEGHLRPILSVTRMDWKPLGMIVCENGKEWTEVRFAFNSWDSDQVRLEWFCGATGELYTAAPGTSYLDDIAIREVTNPPESLRTAFSVMRHKHDEEIPRSRLRGGPVGNPKPLRPIVCRNGVLRYKDGGEVALWGVNMQTPLSWEYNGRLKNCGVPLEAAALKQITEKNLDQLQLMGAQVIRAHLLPADFTDGEGNLRDTVFLDVLDHLIAQCHQRSIYVYLTLANDMNSSYCPDSFVVGHDISKWLFDDLFVTRLERYIQALLKHRNRYNGKAFCDETAIAVFEVINEPRYLSYVDVAGSADCAPYRKAFEEWCAARNLKDNPSTYFRVYRYELVRRVVDRLAKAIRSAGSRKPVVWNLNWPSMNMEHEDVFQAVADSTVDAVSFCCYPGQSDVPNPYWNHPMDLSARNYLPYLHNCYDKYERLRWLLGERFARKAKVTYEFETFFNTTGYLYPAMARLFRGLGSQMAMVWQYTLSPAAEYCTGSHYLNVEGSPQKAVSFNAAARAFSDMPRFAEYDSKAKSEMTLGHWSISFERKLSVFSDDKSLVYSNSFDKPPLPIGSHLREVVGWGKSPVASYEGTGAYFVKIERDQIHLQILPDVTYVRQLWEGRGRSPFKPACKFNTETRHRFSLHLPAWEGKLKVLSNGNQVAVATDGTFEITPGKYQIVREKD